MRGNTLWKEWHMRERAIPFKVLIGILLFFVGIIPLLVQSKMLSGFYSHQRIDSKMQEMQSQCLMIGN